jgi:FkbM family methyltransferase
MLFARRWFYRLNRFLFRLALRGMGVLNYESDRASGENHFLRHSLARLIAGRKELVVIDVGANEGSYACRIREIYPHSKVYAFEPHPETFKRLRLSGLRAGFQVFNLGCGEISRLSRLYDYRKASETGTPHASLYEDVITKIHGSEPESWDVQVVDLDSFIEERAIQRVHLLKIDAEGHELSVVRGVLDSVACGIIDIIQFEFNSMNVISRRFLRDFYDVLPQYEFFRMLPDGLAPLGSYDPLMCELFAYQNIVAVPQRCLYAEK